MMRVRKGTDPGSSPRRRGKLGLQAKQNVTLRLIPA